MDAACTIQDSIHVFSLVHKYVSRILGTYHLWIRQDRHFYFRLIFLEDLFSLSRKASNATIKLPKDISNANIPMKIEMIS